MQQNKSVRKFLTRLNNELNLVNIEYNKRIYLPIALASLKKKSGFISDTELYFEEMNIQQKEKDLFQNYHDLNWLGEHFANKGYFVALDLLEKVICNFGFSDKEHVEILAYQLGENIKYIEGLYQIIIKESGFMGKHLPDEVIDKYVSFSFEQRVRGTKMENAKNSKLLNGNIALRKYISNSGQFLPNNDIQTLITLLNQIGLEISDYQINLIARTCEERYLKLQEAQIDKNDIIKLPTITSYADKKKQEEIQKQQQIAKAKALKSLKSYLKEDLPIKYITDEELDVVMSLLNIIGYSKEHIAKIKRAIQENNENLNKEYSYQTLQKAKSLYLSDTENNLVIEVECLLSRTDELKNPFLDAICSNYSLLKELLLQLYGFNNDDTEELESIKELIDITIEDLNQSLINYKLSDYRFGRALRNND